MSEQLVEQLEQRLAAREQELLRASRRLEEGQPAEALADETAFADPPAAAEADGPSEVEQRLEQRIRAVTERELAIARRAGPLAALEQRLTAKEAELRAREQLLGERESAARAATYDTAPPRPAVEQPRPAAPPAPAAAAPVEPPQPALAGAISLEALERLVARSAERRPDHRDEWSYYLLYLRDYSEPDGTLPASLRSLIEEVFGELLERAPGT